MIVVSPTRQKYMDVVDCAGPDIEGEGRRALRNRTLTRRAIERDIAADIAADVEFDLSEEDEIIELLESESNIPGVQPDMPVADGEDAVDSDMPQMRFEDAVDETPDS